LIGEAEQAGKTNRRRIEAEPGMDRSPNPWNHVRVIEPPGFERADKGIGIIERSAGPAEDFGLLQSNQQRTTGAGGFAGDGRGAIRKEFVVGHRSSGGLNGGLKLG
jgi:hypothetical protein